MAVRAKSALPEEFDDLEYQEYPELLPRQNEAYGKLVTAKPGSYTILGYGGGMGGGKAGDINSTIWTPFGPRRLGDIKVGDQVCNPDGTVSRVIVLHPIHRLPVYRVSTVDGASTRVTAEHLWLVKVAGKATKAPRYREDGTRDDFRIMTTLDLKRKVDWANQEERKGKLKYWPLIPLTQPVKFTVGVGRSKDPQPLDPYLLGVLLGDGSLTGSSVTFSSADQQIVDLVSRALPDGEIVQIDAIQWRVRGSTLKAKLEYLGVWGKRAEDKSIPRLYRYGNIDDRWSILQGLMDTDGTADSRGHCSFTSVSMDLAQDVQFLARSLGFKATITTNPASYRLPDGTPKECRDAHTVYIQGPNTKNLFRLDRKRERCHDKFNGGASEALRRVVSVEEDGEADTRCITVDHPNGLYLADDFIVTHNSILLSTIANQFLLSYPGTRILLCRDTLKALKETTLIDFMSMLPRQLVLKYNQSENWLRVRRETWPKGVYSQINFQGVHDYEAIGSAAYQIILLDEAHEIPDAAARFLMTRLRWQLPKSVKKALSTQCRYVEQGEGGWLACGARVFDGACPQHGPDWVSSEIPYYFVATANPWPGWYTDWFWKKHLGDALAALGEGSDVSLHFVQSLMRDNKHLPRNYEALNTVGLTHDERRRFIDGEFGVFTGMVYEMFDRRVHAWKQPEIPMYNRVIGGLDFGNESSTGHYTTGVVLLVTPSGRLMMVDEFKRRGPKVYEQQGLWMQKMQEKWGKPIGKKIEWRGDKAQGLGIKMMADLGFNITKSNKPGMDRIDVGIRHCAGLLNHEPGSYPGFFYLPEGHPQGGCPQFEKEMMEYRRDPETLKVVKESDDMVDAFRYACELIQGISGDPSKLFRNSLPSMETA